MNAHEDTSHSYYAQENKARWKKKINGDDVVIGETRNETTKNQNVFERTDAEETGNRGHDRKYALYWDQTDDPSYNSSGGRNGRRTTGEGGVGDRSAVEEEGTATNAQFPFRRKRFDDLKSIQERKKEAAEADQAFNYGWVDY